VEMEYGMTVPLNEDCVTIFMAGLWCLDVAGANSVAIVRRRLYYRGRMLSMHALRLRMWSVG